MGFGQRHGNSGYGNGHGGGRLFNRGKKKPKPDFTERQPIAIMEAAPQPQPVNVDANQPPIYSGFQLWVHSPMTLNSNSFDSQIAVSPENEQQLVNELGQLAARNGKLELQLKTPESDKPYLKFKLINIRDIPKEQYISALQNAKTYFGSLATGLQMQGFLPVCVDA